MLDRTGPSEEPVAVLLEKDTPLFPTIMGILKAGKCYVPLDVGFPMARTSHMLEDSRARLVVTNGKNLSMAGELAGDESRILNVDDVPGEAAFEDPGVSIPPETPAWILYTSGSTGQPKGVIQTHRNALHFVMNYTNNLHICPEDRLTLLFSGCVNGGAHDIFTTLLNGAALFPYDIHGEGLAGLADWLVQERITSYASVPTLFRHFIDTLNGEESFPDLRLVRLIGEPVFDRDLEAYRRHFSDDCLFLNRLGSTETGSLLFFLADKQTEVEGPHVPVGHPVDGHEVMLLDDDGSPVGPNQVGEIAVKSRYLSPGYWGRPDLTESTFGPDPGGGDERVYLMGDLGQSRPDGSIVCLGRKDFQIKIRGYRVETAEVELALMGIDGIREACVVAREDARGDARLVAYVVHSDEDTPPANVLRRTLADSLPDYMIPSDFVPIDALPTTPNGKVDRRALPAPERAQRHGDDRVAGPRSPLESHIAELWCEALDIDEVGTYDNFFELGGESLLAMNVIAKLKKTTGISLEPREFAYQTLGQLAASCEQQMARQPAKPKGVVRRLIGRIAGTTFLAKPSGGAGQDRP